MRGKVQAMAFVVIVATPLRKEVAFRPQGIKLMAAYAIHHALHAATIATQSPRGTASLARTERR